MALCLHIIIRCISPFLETNLFGSGSLPRYEKQIIQA